MTGRAAHHDEFVVAAGLASTVRSPDTREQVEFAIARLALASGSRILDLPCGNGRHALLLARRGYRVTAVDASAACIAAARAGGRHRNLAYAQLDVTAVGVLGVRFDAVVSLCSCLGYLATDAANLAALRTLLSVVRPGGRILLSTANRGVMRGRAAAPQVFDTADYTIERRDAYDPASRTVEHRFRVLDKLTGRWTQRRHRRRIYTRSELTRVLQICGVAAIECFADYRSAPFHAARSPHAIYVGTVGRGSTA
jgi:2-polyprenyl-3-methyl-5-hydroxy-6-metoxy-1,4-benzoquinol methylase